MDAGKAVQPSSPIVRTLARLRTRTIVQIHVHISRSWFEKKSASRAKRVFRYILNTNPPNTETVLIYCNARRRTFAILGTQNTWHTMGQPYWDDLAKSLKEDLLSTYHENALAIAALTVGISLGQHSPGTQTGSSR